jgi:hypothetical protein
MRILRSLYCDDIRQEMGGKVSLMGIYTGVMYLSEMPALLPRICIHSSLSVPIDDAIEQLLFELVIDGNVALTIPGKLPPESTAPVDLLTSPVARTVTIGAVLSPFPVEKPCLLETRIRIGNDIVQGSRLHVLKAKTEGYTPQPVTLPG